MSGLEVLARVIPQSGRGLTVEEIEEKLKLAGIIVDRGRVELILEYCLGAKMVTREDGRYRQVVAL